MKKTTILILSIFLVILSSCKAIDNDLNEEKQQLEVEYSEMYEKNRESAYPLISSDKRHAAYHGYYLMREQGYNQWFYVDEFGNNMILDQENDSWIYNDSYIKDSIMHVENHQIARTFHSMYNGNAVISGTIKQSENSQSSAIFSIKINDNIILEEKQVNQDDTTGIYYEIDVVLQQGDVVSFIVNGENATVLWNPVVDCSGEIPGNLHYKLPSGAYLGDVHPFYDNEHNRMYMYYLSTNGRFDSQLITSDDMITYHETNLLTDPINPPEQDNYFVLGVYKDSDVYRTFYGLGDSFGSAESDDLITWRNASILDETFNVERKAFFDYDNFPGGGRDPYGFYDSDIDRFRIIGISYVNHPSNRSLVLYTSNDEEGRLYTDKPVELINYPNNGDGDPECPMMMKIGDYWYIFTSRYGQSVHGVGRLTYYIGDKGKSIDEVDWQSKEEHHLDGEDLIAAQLVQIGQRYYVYGWLPQTWNGGNWGGLLNLPREVVQFEDGTLGSRLDEYFFSKINKGVDINFTGQYTSGTFSGNSSALQSVFDNAVLTFDGNYKRALIETNVSLTNSNAKQGITINQNGKNYQATIERINNELKISFGEIGSNHNPSSYLIIPYQSNVINVKLLIEGGCGLLSINDSYTLTFRSSMTLDSTFTVGVFADLANTMFENFKIYRLADLVNIYE